MRLDSRREIRGTGALIDVDYLYDVENRWIGENIFTSSGEHETRFAYDGNQIVLEFDKDVVDNNATVGVADLSHRYVWQPNAVDQLMADEQVTTPTTAGKVVWTLGDNQGTIRDLAVTESGVTSVATHRIFDSYGNLVGSTNPSTGEVAAVACLFGYTGKAFDNATGLQNNLNRWYDSTVGRWLSVDPTGFDGMDANTYRYVGNSPTNAVDPSGLDDIPRVPGLLPDLYLPNGVPSLMGWYELNKMAAMVQKDRNQQYMDAAAMAAFGTLGIAGGYYAGTAVGGAIVGGHVVVSESAAMSAAAREIIIRYHTKAAALAYLATLREFRDGAPQGTYAYVMVTRWIEFLEAAIQEAFPP